MPESELALIYDARGTGIDRHVGAAPEAREILRPKSVTVNPIARGLELHPTPKKRRQIKTSNSKNKRNSPGLHDPGPAAVTS